MKKLANLRLHKFPARDELMQHGLEPVGEPMGTDMGLAALGPEQLADKAVELIRKAQLLGAEAVLIGGLTSLHYHLITLAHALGWDVWESLSYSYRKCVACYWKEEGRFDECPRCGARAIASYEYAGMRKVIPTFALYPWPGEDDVLAFLAEHGL